MGARTSSTPGIDRGRETMIGLKLRKGRRHPSPSARNETRGSEWIFVSAAVNADGIPSARRRGHRGMTEGKVDEGQPARYAEVTDEYVHRGREYIPLPPPPRKPRESFSTRRRTRSTFPACTKRRHAVCHVTSVIPEEWDARKAVSRTTYLEQLRGNRPSALDEILARMMFAMKLANRKSASSAPARG